MTDRPLFARCSAALVGAAVMAAAHVADAAWMAHYDLAGLVLSSEAVVSATRVSTRSPAPYQRLETFRVTRSVAGSLRIGDTVEVDTNLYNTREITPAIGADAVLFLHRSQSTTAGQPGPWSLVSSGLRVSSNGRAYRFVQFNNPGGFDPVPQGNDPDDVRSSDARTQSPVSWSELATSVDRAVALAARVRALEARGASTPRGELLSLLGPAPDATELLLGSNRAGFYRDVIGDRVAQMFAARNDAAGVMAVAIRSQADEEGYAPVPALSDSSLWSLIDDDAQAPELRAAAVRAVQRHELLTAASAQRIGALTRDASPLVRMSAARVLVARRDGFGSERGDAARLRAVRAAVDRVLTEYVPRESDPVAQYALFLRGGDGPSALGARAPRSAFFARVNGRSMRIGVANRNRGNALPTVSSVDLQFTAAQGALPCGAQTVTATMSTMGAVEYTIPLRCAGARAGTYTARATITVDRAAGPRVRVVDLGSIQW